VRVSVSATSRELRISVADAGPGYSRRRAQPGAATGAGLGLKLSRVLAAKAGGTLTLVKDEASGSEFVLRLPIRATPASAARQYLPRFLAGATEPGVKA
jgi:signal transduction histidine kinase